MHMIEQALIFATNAHMGQTRRDGTPYIMHPIRVAVKVQSFTNDPKVISAALMHDVIEDTSYGYDDIKEFFSSSVADLVFELTTDEKEKNKVGKAVYLSEKMLKMSTDAFMIKLCDRFDNVSDLNTSNNAKWVNKYKVETNHILDKLYNQRKNVYTFKKLMSEIREKVN